MALTYDMSKIVNKDLLKWNAIRNCIFATMAVGINEITKDNCDEFAVRLTMLRPTGISSEWITKQDVIDCIGLKTNATTLTKRRFKSQWLKRKGEEFERQWAGLPVLPCY
jgi:hypothetical protein